MATGSNILAWKNSMDRGAWRAHGVAELDTTEHTHTHTHTHTTGGYSMQSFLGSLGSRSLSLDWYATEYFLGEAT